MPDIQSPIINRPFEEPTQYWDWDANRVLGKIPFRRKAGYHFRSEGSMDLFSPDNYVPLTLVNLLRDDVKRWRESDYRGASSVTRELFAWWFDDEEVQPEGGSSAYRRPKRERGFFFCQREAVETVVYLVEMRFANRSRSTGFQNFALSDDDILRMLSGEAPHFHEPLKDATGEVSPDDIVPCLVDPSPNFPLDLTRIGCKMATGSGKTVVMALLLAWAFCNHSRNPLSTQFPGAALIVAPNLTVKERLQVLRPDVTGNYFELFSIVPSHLMPALQSGKVLVENWHKFAPQAGDVENGVKYRVVDKGEESPNDFARRVLGDLYDRMPLLVMNDEGHHCWRPNAAIADKVTDAELKAEVEEARMWLEGLDKINNGAGEGKAGVSLCVDLSATPFYISGSGHPEGRPFPWLVSDFGLTDAIESGIVKVPRIPVQDGTGKPEPKYFQLWKTIQAEHKQNAGARKMKPEEIYTASEGALLQLAGQWHGTFHDREQRVGADAIPPVMIVVCNDKKSSQLFFEKISGQREIAATATVEDVEAESDSEDSEIETEAPKKKTKAKTQTTYGPGLAGFEEFWNTSEARRTIRIDTDALEAAENEDGKKQGAAEELRKLISTVGRRGESGEQVRCVVAVSMLNEGWDSNNVTHILGVRAFSSQLLCEQVVGRGLRRLSYDVDPQTGLLGEEYADVYGIPFSVVPFKGEVVGGAPPKPQVRTAIKALESRCDYELRFPNVEGYAFALSKFALKCDVAAMQELHLEPYNEPSATFIAPTVAEGLGLTPFGFKLQNRETFYQNNHLQTVKFRITAMLLDDLVNPKNESDRKARVLSLQARHQLFAQIFGFVDAYIGTPENESKVRFNGQHEAEIGLEKYVGRIVGRLRDAITPDQNGGEAPLLPLLNRFKPIASTKDVNFVTARTVKGTQKSHISGVVGDTKSWEQAAAFALEESGLVRCYARNDHLGLRIPYEYQGVEHFYEPDFLVEMMDEHKTKVLLEIKGYEDDQDRAKHDAAQRWLEGVNNWKQQGVWYPQIVVCKEPHKLKGLLAGLFKSASVSGPHVADYYEMVKLMNLEVGQVPTYEVNEDVELKRAIWLFEAGEVSFNELPELTGQQDLGALEVLLSKFKLPEGMGLLDVLGTYDSANHHVTLYDKLIQFVASKHGWGVETLRHKVHLHELAHAASHLGLDKDGKDWPAFSHATRDSKEYFAQIYAYQMLAKEGDLQGIALMEELSEKQPPCYGTYLKDAELPLSQLHQKLLEAREDAIRLFPNHEEAFSDSWSIEMDGITKESSRPHQPDSLILLTTDHKYREEKRIKVGSKYIISSDEALEDNYDRGGGFFQRPVALPAETAYEIFKLVKDRANSHVAPASSFLTVRYQDKQVQVASPEDFVKNLCEILRKVDGGLANGIGRTYLKMS